MLKSLKKDPVISETRIWLGGALVIFPMLVLFFKPTFWEFVGFYLIDSVGYFLCQFFDIRLFHRFWPESRLYFPNLDPQVLQIKTLPERKSLYREILNFPRNRALFIGFMSCLKVIPAFIFAFAVWSHHVGALFLLLKGLCVCAFSFSFMIGMSYLGYHNRISNLVQEVHEKSDWSEVFKSIDTFSQDRLFQKFEIISGFSVWTFWTFMLVLIISSAETPLWMAITQSIYVSIAGLYFSAQLIVASRQQIMQGLENLVLFYENSSEMVRSKGLALSTNPTLAFYQKTLNEMIEKNAESEKEIHRWILRQAEDSRYLHLGRLTGLLVHDLLTPLTVMRYSLSVLDEQKAINIQSLPHAERLRFSLDQTTDFIKNIRGSIRDQSTGYRESSPDIAHKTATKMVSYLYDQDKFSCINFYCDMEADLKASIPQPELNQVFLNLYSNAVKNLIAHAIAHPRVSIQFLHETAVEFVLVVKDNGTGLSNETFHYITEEAERLPGNEGIGLKLTKRLIELYGGTLQLIQPVDGVGSEFHLTLRKAGSPEAKFNSMQRLSRSSYGDKVIAKGNEYPT